MSAYLESHFDAYLNRTTFDTSYCKDEHITVLPLDRASLRPFAETYIQASDRKQNIKVETYMYQEKKYILVYASKNIPRDATFYATKEVYRKITKRKKSKR